jgi:hypothetical protein
MLMIVKNRPLSSVTSCRFLLLSGDDIEQTANTYNIDACNEALVMLAKPNLSNPDWLY